MIIQAKIRSNIVKLFQEKFQVENRLSSKVSTARFNLEAEETWSPPALSCGNNIVAFGGYTRPHIKEEVQINNIEETRWLDNFFGGYIATVGHRLIGVRRIYQCSAQDYNIVLHSILVTETYAAPLTEQEIIDDLFATYWSDIDTTTYVDGTETIASINFTRLYLDEALNQLAKLNGKEWYIDYQKKLHYFTPAEGTSPFGLWDSLS